MRRLRSGWSAEARVLLDPGSVFRELIDERTTGLWPLFRRPLFLTFLFGCVVSIEASGRVTARLILDGMISFAFVSFFEGLSLAIVYRRRPRSIPFTRAADLFFITNAPWLLWLVAFATVRAFESPMQATARAFAQTWLLVASLALATGWSAWIDVHFFRVIMPRPDGAARDLLLQRTIGWTCTLGYFLGMAIWPEIAGRILL